MNGCSWAIGIECVADFPDHLTSDEGGRQYLGEVLTQVVLTVLALACGFAAGVYVNHAHRSLRSGPRWISAAVMVGGLVLLQVVHAEVWPLAGYLAGMALSFALSHLILDRRPAGGRDRAAAASDK